MVHEVRRLQAQRQSIIARTDEMWIAETVDTDAQPFALFDASLVEMVWDNA